MTPLRVAGAAICALLLFGACGNPGSPYENVRSLAAALEAHDVPCDGLRVSGKTELVKQKGRCRTRGGKTAELYTFADESRRDEWLSVGAHFGEVVVGPNWAVSVESRAQAEAVSAAIGGETI